MYQLNPDENQGQVKQIKIQGAGVLSLEFSNFLLFLAEAVKNIDIILYESLQDIRKSR